MNTIQGAEVSNQEVLERFFQVPVTHVDVFWSGKSNTTGRTQRERIGVGPKMGRFHLQSDNWENEDPRSVPEDNSSEIQPNL